jgi:2-C-methyl-D-erythritol 2,4-cyclodiphosphate synthase
MKDLRVGIGYDVHPFADGRDLVLGGIKIEFSRGLMGHSDADVLVHAVIDSLLGACGMGDIGALFPDTDSRYKDISSILLLKKVGEMLTGENIDIINIDTVLICESPRIAPYIDKMKAAISTALDNLDPKRIGIKGKTTEKLGFTGRGEGIAAHAVSLIQM